MAKGGFGTVSKAIWKDGYICSWDYENDQWIRSKSDSSIGYLENYPVALKYLHNSQNITEEFLKEVS